MKLFKKLRKGFTLIELVVVIAVIAILSAVSVVSYVAITNRAKQSADEQAVRQMNTVLMANEILSGQSVLDAVNALSENGYAAADYNPLAKGKFFFWDQNDNRIVYAEYKNNDYVGIYPDAYAGKSYSSLHHQWFSLNTDVKKNDVTYVSDPSGNTFSTNDGKDVAGLIDTIRESINKTAASSNETAAKTVDGVQIAGMGLGGNKNFYGLTGSLVINLTGDVDLMGSSFNLNLMNATFTLNGNGHTIKGISNMSGFAVSNANSEGVDSEYGGAFIGYAKNSTVTFNDVKFENCSFGKETVKGSAVFVGQSTNSNINFIKTEVTNCTVDGLKGVAVYVGHNLREESYTGSLEIAFSDSNVINGATLRSKDAGQVGTAIGRFTKNGTTGTMSLTGSEHVSYSNVSQYANNVKYSTLTWIANGSNASAVQITTKQDFSR